MMVIVSIFAYFLCPVVTGYIMRSFAKELPECKGLTPGRCPAASNGGCSNNYRIGSIYRSVARRCCQIHKFKTRVALLHGTNVRRCRKETKNLFMFSTIIKKTNYSITAQGTHKKMKQKNDPAQKKDHHVHEYHVHDHVHNHVHDHSSKSMKCPVCGSHEHDAHQHVLKKINLCHQHFV